ncbi:DNA-3-methyladenine glycosylase I [Faucicola mancuniensis]|uniref:DNA-3-methyladenine glycosylase I n=1 Tax=Faucicola mancuniensis TaxID=1309795 RepID=UPI00397794B9
MQNQSLKRCIWCGDDPLYQAYHDTEWGKIIDDDKTLFALLCLESMQAGLSWITILRKRERFYQVFDNFDPNKVAFYDENKINELMMDAGIIRNRAKINAIIHNANLFLKITQNQSFSDYLWAMSPNGLAKNPLINHPTDISQIPATTEFSDKMAKQLKKDGFKFLGSTTCYAFMQSCGMVNDHVADCDFR